MTLNEVLAIIPARGGSKSIPRKNVRAFSGHPLIAYSIAAAKQAHSITRVIVSTDDEEIAAVARAYGAEVPFLRPAALAQDATTDFPVFEHALRWLRENEDYQPEIVVQLRPTSPIRPRTCVDDAISILREHPDADSVRGVVPSGQNPYKMWRISDEGPMQPLLMEGFQEAYNMPRQILPTTYWQTGHIDAIRVETILKKGSMSGDVIMPLIIDPHYTVDIDNPRDWGRAEWLLGQGHLEAVLPGREARLFPPQVEFLVLDFDGVLTDNRVWVNQDGEESIAANRSDGMGLSRLLKEGCKVAVLSTEKNPVVEARCRKLQLPVRQAVEEKGEAVERLMKEFDVQPQRTLFVGNDINDVPCFSKVGYAVVVADAHPDAMREADLVLQNKGGHGAVREICDIILSSRAGKDNHE